MSWTKRLGALSTFRAEGVAWGDLWVLLARGENNRGIGWLQVLLWDLKFAAFLLSIEEKACRTCGGPLDDGAHKLVRYCTTACRKVAYRCRQAGTPTEYEALLEEAGATKRRVEQEIADAHRWHRRHQNLCGDQTLLPPDLARIDHLPYVPSRCGVGCGSGPCGHTGAVCVFARTGSEVTP